MGAKDAIFGKAEEIKEDLSAEGQDLPHVWAKADEKICNMAAESLVQEAQSLKSEACRQIGQGEVELAQAQKAQAAAALVAERANMMTEKAVANEIQGQEKLVAAGNKLMQAGQELQQEAASMGSFQADVNLHATTQMSQNTSVEVPPVQPAQFHVLQSRVGVECRPVVETQMASETIGVSRPPIH